ncbi:MAG: Co2+/Mg2+ efflux protein ApaG [Aquisalinus sp.]|nr:Co2+/Mg2+ efflux protein ApaG [Aquisalinus sp.]
MYENETRGIRISVEPDYLEDQSEPYDDHYVWAYTIRIDNTSSDVVQLKTRHWRITDAQGRTEVVNGDGVVGEQPMLFPGDVFEYTSGAPLTTPSGLMVGSYGMETMTGEHFEAAIPAFSLDSPHELRQIN